MTRRAWFQAAILTLALCLSAALGLYLAHEVWPVGCQDASPSELSAADQCRWAGWIADVYANDGDAEAAVAALTGFSGSGVEALCRLSTGECLACRAGQAENAAALATALQLACSD